VFCFFALLFVTSFASERIILPKNLIPIPLYRQQAGYSCGPSSALSLLRYWRWYMFSSITEQQLYRPMKCTTSGTDPGPIAQYFNTINISAIYLKGNDVSLSLLQTQIDRRRPCIVDIQAWTDDKIVNWTADWDDGHFNVLVGYDRENLFFMDPSTDDTYAFIPKTEFLDRWHDVDGDDNIRTYRMVILVDGSGNSNEPVHPVPPVYPYATREN